MIKYLQDVEIRADIDMFGRFESFLPSSSGLSPFSVINNLLNVNFNADLFEGEHGTFYLNRANHTGVQAISTIAGLQAALDVKQPTLSGTGLVKSTAGAISYITDNSSNWNTAVGWGDYKLRSLTVNGTAGRITSSAGAQTLAADRTWTIDLATTGVAVNTYKSVTVDVYGRITAGTNPNTLAGYGITDAASITDLTSYVRKSTADNITADHNFTGTNLSLPGQTFYNLFPSTSNVYLNYYPAGTSVNTFANFRVWDNSGGTQRILRIGGDNTFTWGGVNVVLATRQVATSTGLTGGGDLSANRTLSFDTTWGDARYSLVSASHPALTIGTANGLSLAAGQVLSMSAASSTITGALTSTDWSTFNSKQSALSGTGLVKSTAGVISYVTDNSANWNTAFSSLSDYVQKNTANTISADHIFTAIGLRLSPHYFHGTYDGSNVYTHFYPSSAGNGAISTNANFRVWNGPGNTLKTLRVGGDGTFIWDGKNVATENWVIAQDRFTPSLTAVTDLNNVINGGVKYWVDTTTNRPEGYGTSLTFVGLSHTGNLIEGGWISQILSGTSGNWFVRRGGGAAGPTATWGSTYQLWTEKQFTQTQITNWDAAYSGLSGKENSFSKGDLIQGTGITFSGSGVGRLYGAGNITITATATGVGGGGTTNYIPLYTSGTTIGNSYASQSGGYFNISSGVRMGNNGAWPYIEFANNVGAIGFNFYNAAGTGGFALTYSVTSDEFSFTRIGGSSIMTFLANGSIAIHSGAASPLTVTSTIVNTNFNADLLDGYHASHLADRANHNGTQAISTITGLQSGLDGKVSIGTANNVTAAHVFSGEITLPGSLFKSTYDGSNSYFHFYSSGGNGAVNSIGNFRVWDGAAGSFKTLRFGGDGVMMWNGEVVATQNYVTSQGYITSAALAGYATESWTNSQGFLKDSSITYSLIVSKLGYTPYNDSNPSGYITASSGDTLTNKGGNISQWTNNMGYIANVTYGMVTGALGYTPMRDDRYITFNGTNYYINSNPNIGSSSGGVTGSGSFGMIPVWFGSSVLSSSDLYYNGFVYGFGGFTSSYHKVTATGGFFVSDVSTSSSSEFVFEVASTTRLSCPWPVMTQSQRGSASAKNAGAVWQSDVGVHGVGLYVYLGGAWFKVAMTAT